MAGEKILLVDDDSDVLQLLDRLLSGEGYHITKANSGNEATQAIKTFSPELIIMDIMMPDMYGSEVVQLLNEDPAFTKAPIIFLSGIIGNQDDVSGSGINISGRYYRAISKPFDSKELLREVKNAFGK